MTKADLVNAIAEKAGLSKADGEKALKAFTDAIEEGDLDQKSLKEYISHIKTVSEEMDAHIIKLNKAYSEIRKKINNN